jgi:Pvc16 N-terminal domain
MLHLAAEFLRRELNGWLVQRTGSNDPFGTAVLTRIAADTGKWDIPNDRIGVALVNLEEERAVRSQVPQAAYVEGRQVMREPEIKLNLYLIFASHFGNYEQALKQLSFVLTFFQGRPVFTPERYPALDARIRKLGVDLMSLGYEQLNQLWAFIGAKQLPSVVYRVRLVALQDDEPATVGAPITRISSSVEAL